MTIQGSVIETIQNHKMLQKGDRVLVGVSGGKDSTALLHVLYSLKEVLSIDLGVLHVNHCLRGEESERDERFVRDAAKRLDIACFTEKVEVGRLKKENHLSVQAAGRKVRTASFFKIASEHGFNKIAVGHNKNDQGETVLINLMRGTGVRGLRGIHPVYKKKIIRPLIGVSREDISRYLSSESIPFVEDSSNATSKYTRNRIRHELLPTLEKTYNRKIVESLCNLSETSREDEQLLHDMAEKNFKDTLLISEEGMIALDIKRFNVLHLALKRRVLRLSIEKVRGSLDGIAFEHISSLLDLIGSAKTGKRYLLPGNSECSIEYGKVIFYRKNASPNGGYLFPLAEIGISKIENLNITIEARQISGEELLGATETDTVKVFDFKGTKSPLFVRSRRKGDTFHPSGMVGSLKLKKFFINTKVPRRERDSLPLIVYGNDILWIPGMRRSSRYTVTTESRGALLLSINSSGHDSDL